MYNTAIAFLITTKKTIKIVQPPGIRSPKFGHLGLKGKTKAGAPFWYSFRSGRFWSLDSVPSLGFVASRQFMPLKNCWIGARIMD